MLSAKRLLLVCLVASAALVAGCGGQRTTVSKLKGDGSATPAQVAAFRGDLRAFQEEFERLVGSAAEHIQRADVSAEAKKNAVLWKVRVTEGMEDKVGEKDVRIATLSVWVESIRVHRYFTTGDGKYLFETEQPRAQRVSRQTVDMVERLIGQHIPRERVQKLKPEVVKYAREHPMIGIFEQGEPASLQVDGGVLDGMLKVAGLPFAPFNVSGKIEKGTEQINVTANRFADIVEDLPRETRWQAEVMLLTLDENKTVKEILEDIDQLSLRTERIGAIIEDMPRNSREQAEIFIKSVDKSETVQGALAGITQMSATADKLAATADALPEKTRIEVEKVLTSLNESELAKSALVKVDRMTDSADTLTRVVEKLPDDVGRVMGQTVEALNLTVDKSATHGTELTDHMAVRAAQLLVLAFVLGAGLIVLARVFRSRRAARG